LGGGSFHGRINRFQEQLLLKSNALLCFALLCFALLCFAVLGFGIECLTFKNESRVLLLGEGSFHGRINRFPEQLLLQSGALLCFAVLCCALLWNLMLDI